MFHLQLFIVRFNSTHLMKSQEDVPIIIDKK